MRFDQTRELVGGRTGPRCNCLRRLEISCHALQTNELERSLLGREVIVEARLSYAEDVGDILRRRAVETALREDPCGGLDERVSVGVDVRSSGLSVAARSS